MFGFLRLRNIAKIIWTSSRKIWLLHTWVQNIHESRCLLFCFSFQCIFLLNKCLRSRKAQNITCTSIFYPMKLTEDPEMQPILFGLFLTMYLITVVGNMLIILVVTMDMQLHLLMYFFLLNLSLAYIWFVSATVPKLISDIRISSTVIS
jgi:olfactory receptor